METTRHYLTTKEIIDGADCPLDVKVVPNQMGINLCSLAGVEWTRRGDEQLVNLTLHFLPAPQS